MSQQLKLLKRILKDNHGFLILEVAIALLIIGLLVGGVLKAQELLESSKLQASIKNIESYRLSAHLFQDRYGALPGDFSEATTYISSTLKNGNGNGIIEGDEASQFWQHLVAAGFISGTGPQGPQEKMGGTVAIVLNPEPDLPGHWLRWGEINGNKNDGALLTPLQARTVCQKMGNMDFKTGSVRIKDGANSESGKCLTSDGQLNGSLKKPACVIYVSL